MTTGLASIATRFGACAKARGKSVFAVISALAIVASFAFVSAAPDAEAMGVEIRVITLHDRDRDDDWEVDFDARLPISVELFVNGASQGAPITTSFTSIGGNDDLDDHDVLGTATTLDTIIVCGAVPANYFIGPGIVGVADPDGQGRLCMESTVGAGPDELVYLGFIKDKEFSAFTYRDLDGDAMFGAGDATLISTAEYFVNGVSQGTETIDGVTFLTFMDTGDTVMVCVEPIADHTIFGSSFDPDPDGLDRSCREYFNTGLGSGSGVAFYLGYTRNGNINIRTLADTNGSDAIEFGTDERVEADVEVYVDGTSVASGGTGFTGVQPETVGDIPLTADADADITVCAEPLPSYRFVTSSDTAVADPDSADRPCASQTMLESDLPGDDDNNGRYFDFLFEAGVDPRVLTAVETLPADQFFMPASETRVETDVEYYLDGVSQGSMTTSYSTTELVGVYDSLPAVLRGETLLVCATVPSGHRFSAANSALVPDPEGSTRPCIDATVPVTASVPNDRNFTFLFTPAIDLRVLTGVENEPADGVLQTATEDRAPVDVELFVEGASVGATTTSYDTPQSSSMFDIVGDLGIDEEAVLCVDEIVDYEFSSMSLPTAPDPDGLDRNCGSLMGTNGLANVGFETITILFLEVTLCDGRVVTIDMNTNGGNGTGTAGNDVILGTNGDDTIDGLGGNDTICGGQGNDTIDGGPGVDRILGQAGDDDIDGGTELDRIWGGSDDDTIDGGDGDDIIRANGGDDTVHGGEGADRIYGNGGFDTLYGDGGDDRLFGNADDDEVHGGLDNDDLYGHSGVDTMHGGDGDDLLNGSTDGDLLYGDDGTDTLRGGSDDDTLDGGDGDDDTVVGQGGDDTLSGGAGTGDVCRGKSHTNGDVADATCETITDVP